MIYHFMALDEPVIDIEVDEKNRILGYKKHVLDCPKQPFWGDNITTERLYKFLKSRCYEDCRANLKEILDAHGLASNNAYEWNKLTHGVTYEDFFWIKYDDEDLKWEDVSIR